MSRAEPGRPLGRHFLPLVYEPAKQLLLHSEMPGPNPTGSAGGSAGKVDVPAFPVRDFCRRKDLLDGRSIPSVGPTCSQARGLEANPEMGSRGSWTYCVCDCDKAMTQAVLHGSPQA